MTNIDFFKLQAKNLFSDYKSRVYDDSEDMYKYNPRFFSDVNDIIFNFEINEDKPFSLMNCSTYNSKNGWFLQMDRFN